MLNRLTSETLLDGTLIEYTYDATGNRLTKKVTQGGSVTTTSYQYGTANQLTSAGGINYTYDDNGNMTGDGTRTYLYDAANRLLEVKQGINSIAMFAYDADGRRTSMTTSSGTTRFFYDGASTRVLYETDGNNNLLARYVYGPGGQLLAMVRGSVTYYYHYNGHGDVVALTNASGTVVATYDYDAFGNHLGSTGSVNNPYRYAGYRWDAETGLYYLNARYYAPSVGRFITRDAFHGFEDDPASLNQYNYAHSNPVMFVDPTGYSSTSVSFVVGVVAQILFYVGINMSPLKILYLVASAASAMAQAYLAYSQYNKAVSQLVKSSQNYNSTLTGYKFLRNISYVSAAITFVTSVIGVPYRTIANTIPVILLNHGIANSFNLFGITYDTSTLLSNILGKSSMTAFSRAGIR